LLSAVLAGRNAHPLIQALIEAAKEPTEYPLVRRDNEVSATALLAKCIIDEVQGSPDLLKEAMRWVARRNEHERLPGKIYASKYGQLFEEVCLAEIQTSDSDLMSIGAALSEITLVKLGWPAMAEAFSKAITELLSDTNPIRAACGCLAAMEIGWTFAPKGGGHKKEVPGSVKGQLVTWIELILPFILSEHQYLAFAAIWALVWLSQAAEWDPSSHLHVFEDLVRAWKKWTVPEVRFAAAWAIESLPLVDRNAKLFDKSSDELSEFVALRIAAVPLSSPEKLRWSQTEKAAAVILAYYMRKSWSDEEVVKQIAQHVFPSARNVATDMLETLGGLGEAKLAELIRLSKEDPFADIEEP